MFVGWTRSFLVSAPCLSFVILGRRDEESNPKVPSRSSSSKPALHNHTVANLLSCFLFLRTYEQFIPFRLIIHPQSIGNQSRVISTDIATECFIPREERADVGSAT